MGNITLQTHTLRKIKIINLSIIGIAVMSFISHFYVNIFSYSMYLLTLAFLCAIFVIGKPVIPRFDKFSFLWIISACTIIFSFLQSSRQTGAAFDMTVLLLGIPLVLFPAKKTNTYKSVLNVAIVFAYFYAFGILLQMLIPSLFYAILSVFPSNLREAIGNGGGYNGNYNGFTTNVGFAAGFIATGIMALISRNGVFERTTKGKMIKILPLLIPMFFTGKRGTTLFLAMTIILCYLLSAERTEKLKRYLKIFCVIVAGLILVVLFFEKLDQIPFFHRIFESIEGLRLGEDVTSARSKLSAWAILLFKEHPILGIGWGDYSTTVVGNATLNTSLDTHNIYLQLLCETGLVGAVCMYTLFVVFWNATRRAYRNCLHINDNVSVVKWRSLLGFSFYYQTFFLLYGFSGNPLYDCNHQIMYMISCSILMAFRYACDVAEAKK